MKTCENCGAKLGDNYEICPFCFVDLVPGLETVEKQKKRRKSKRIKIISILISYLLLIVSTISWITISVECFKSADPVCYTTTLILMVICWIFVCVAPVLLGEELTKKEK